MAALYLSDIEEALGSLDSVNMVSAFDLDKFDLRSEFSDMQEILAPYLTLLSPLDKTLFYMYYVHEAKAEMISEYLEVSTTAIYKRIRAIRVKLKLVIYFNMNKEELFRFLKTYWVNESTTAEYIAQFVFHRTSKVKSESELDFKAITMITDRIREAVKAGAENINEYTLHKIKRNNKKHYALIKAKHIVEVIDFIIAKKAYRYNIFRGNLKGQYAY